MADLRDIKHNVSELERMMFGSFADSLNFMSDEKKDYRAIWALIRQTGQSFKGTKFDNPKQREELWNRFQKVVERAKADREKHAKAMEEKKRSSARNLTYIKGMLPMTREGEGFADLTIAIATGGLSIGAKLAADAVFGEEDEELKRLQKASAAVKEAGQYLKDHKGEMFNTDKSEAYEAIRWSQEKLNEEWSEYKGRKKRQREARDQEWQRIQVERKAKHEAWRSKTKDFIERQESWISRMEGKIQSKRNNISKLESQIYDSRSDSFISRAQGWIAEDRAAISDMEEKISDAKMRVSEARGKLQASSWS